MFTYRPLAASQAAGALAADLSAEQRRGVERYAALVEQIQAETTAVLAFADEPAKGTIETVSAKSDLEFGIEALLRSGRLQGVSPHNAGLLACG
ncbi:hypothetical protein ACFV0L_40645 [Streptosporangium canum]|uniref:hypothetical protein n=1 Tax=Streptosporangium canum TaxID=324952 RepID=UPI0036AA977D